MSEIRYVTLTDDVNPILLARVRWPDIAEGITLGRSEWQTDPGLFDLPYDPQGVAVSREQAEQIAADWGALLPGAASPSGSGTSLIRRMPANWSNLSSAERKAWSLELSRIRKSTRRRHARRTAKEPRAPFGAVRAKLRGSPTTLEAPSAGDALEEEVASPGDRLETLVPLGSADARNGEAGTTDSTPADANTSGSPTAATYANLNDPRLTGLRLPVGGTRAIPAPDPNPTPSSRPGPGVR